MPIIDGSDFLPPRRYQHRHYSTFLPSLFGKEPDVKYQRKRINTPDDDFLDLDYIKNGQKRLVILCHGLEGNSESIYVQIQAEAYAKSGWDVLALNYRGCSGEPNRKLRMYNSGFTDDLAYIIDHHTTAYDEISLVGYSLGGNLVLKYAGTSGADIPSKVKSVVAISTPLDLDNASKHLLKWDNFAYQIFFLKSLSHKVWIKKRQFPEDIELKHLRKCYNLYQFDEYYTAPIWGYDSAKDYYDQNASIQWLDQISVPSLIINAKNDPFLGPRCYPINLAQELDNVHLCMPLYGGHVGFAYHRSDRSWLVNKIINFSVEQSKISSDELSISK